jgi:hypothetical protein
MADRPVFIPSTSDQFLVETQSIEFEWVAGMAVTQKQKCINALHAAIAKTKSDASILEISSKSENDLGVQLSAFNLAYRSTKENSYTVECIFQASKVFQNGGPYRDLLQVSSLDAKRDERLKTSGNLIKFNSNGFSWPKEPKTVFYDWVYLNALNSQPELAKQLLEYNAFTDIEFNPKKSINCQAYSAALYVSLQNRGILNDVLESPERFIEVIRSYLVSNSVDNDLIQPGLI